MTLKAGLLCLGLSLSLVANAAAWAEPAPVLAKDVDAAGKPLPFGRPAHLPDSTPLGSGPYKAIMATDPGLPVHVLYYPAKMEAAGQLPVISWGNGACINAGNRFRSFLTEIASHGFLVISAGEMGPVSLEVGPQENPPVPKPGAPPPPPPPAPDPKAPPVVRNTAADLKAAIDWAVAENARPASRFYHRLDTSKIAVAGQSCGTILALDNAGDPRVASVALFSGGVRLNPNGSGPPNSPGTDPKAILDAVHSPILILSGDAEHDIAFAPGGDNFAYLSKVPAFHAWKEQLTHIGTYGMANGGELGRIADAWFAWTLRGDAKAGAMFKGKDCGLCKDPTWHASKKNID